MGDVYRCFDQRKVARARTFEPVMNPYQLVISGIIAPSVLLRRLHTTRNPRKNWEMTLKLIRQAAKPQRLQELASHLLTTPHRSPNPHTNASHTPPNPTRQTHIPHTLTVNPTLSTPAPLGGSHTRLHSPARRLRTPLAGHSFARKPLRSAIRLALRCSPGREVQERGVGEFVGVWVLG